MAKKTTKKRNLRLDEAPRARGRVFRADGWKNVLTGLGIAGKDKRESSTIEWSPLTETDAEILYAASDTAAKIVDGVVNDAFREGYELKFDGSTPELIKKITDEGMRLRVNEKLAEASVLARIYGGAGIVVMPLDVKELEKPFTPESIQEIKSLLVVSRWELNHDTVENDIRSPNFGRPSMYRFASRDTGTGNSGQLIHYTRVLRFDGSYLPKRMFVQNRYWFDSVLNRAQKPIRDYDAALAALSVTIDDFSVAVMKIDGLARMIAEDKDDIIRKRLEVINLSRSVAKTVIMDAEHESYEYQTRQLTGIDAAVNKIASRLVVASDMPHTKILGESPSGSNATGNSTTKDWYDFVHAWQENYLDEKLIKLWKWIFSAKTSPTSGKVPEGLQAIYAQLWQEPESAKADVKLKQAQTDSLYIRDSVLAPTEVAVSRFGSGEYSTETQLKGARPKPPKET